MASDTALKTFIVCVVYRPPESGILCLNDDLMPNYIHTLSLNKPIILTGDLKCDLLTDNPRGIALQSFCIAMNATQLVNDPTRVTQQSSTLIDVVLTSDPALVKANGVLEMTISDHFLVYVVLDLKMPKLKARYVNIRSYKHYNAEKFSADISHIPWNTLDLLDPLDAKVDSFNDLFQTCLENFAPVKTIKIKRRSVPFINEDIKEQIFIRNNLHKIARRTGLVEDWYGFKQQRCKVKLALKAAEVEYYNERI